ncbi:MAG: hypothetical protein FWC41_01820 [Firmicutes bacterium]|nr:hypothetical protein [Bacillota bacterium]
MKRFFKWFNDHKEGILKSVYALPIIFAIGISIFHCIEWFEISNPALFAVALSIGIEVAAATTLVALLFGRMTFSIVMTFILVTLYQMIGNIFFSFHHIDENGELFRTWVAFMSIILGEGSEWTTITHRFWLSVMSGAIVPLLSLLSLHLISTFELKNKKEKPVEVEKTTQPEVEVVEVIKPVKQKKKATVVEQQIVEKEEEKPIETPEIVIDKILIDSSNTPEVENVVQPVEPVKPKPKRTKSKIVLGNPNPPETTIVKSTKPAIIEQPPVKEKTYDGINRKVKLPGFKKYD